MNSVYILVRIDDEYGHTDFLGAFFSRESGESFIRETPELAEDIGILGGLYNSLEEFRYLNGCEGYVLFEEKIK
jgi:hypothetical protein